MSIVKIDNVELSQQEKTELYVCISCRLGIIETGDPMLRAIDAQNSKQNHRIKALSIEQKKLTIMLEELMIKLI